MEAPVFGQATYKIPVANGRTSSKSSFAFSLQSSFDKDVTLKSSSSTFGPPFHANHSSVFSHQRIVVLSQSLLRCFVSPFAFCIALLGAVSSRLLGGPLPQPPTRQEVLRVVISGLPYLLFLFFYGINPYIHLLPVATDIDGANLRNISAWESYLLPWPIHLIVSSVHVLPLDFLAAVPYLAHYIIPVFYPAFLYLIDRLDLVQQFYRMLGFTMWGHYVIWLVLPTLPPWALDFIEAGRRSNISSLAKGIVLAHKEGPAFARIDQFIGLPFFYGMFVGNPVPFGSFPSGHVAWPMCILLTLPLHLRFRFSVYVIWVAWATLHTGHHYVLDIVGAVALVFLVCRILSQLNQMQSRGHVLPI